LHSLKLIVALVLSSASVAHADLPPNPGIQRGQTLDTTVSVPAKLNYLIYLPKDYAKDKQKKWPVLVFLHGSGERGSDLNKVKFHGPPKIVETEKKDLPFIIVSPQCPDGEWWKPVSVIGLVDEVLAKYRADADRVYLTGLSMGGFGTWQTACEFPDRFAAIAPVCGGGIMYQAQMLKNVPVWAFHGEKDQAVPFQESVKMCSAVQQFGGNAKLTLYPTLTHDSWTATYANAELYMWLLSHKRGEKKPPATSSAPAAPAAPAPAPGVSAPK
jgi:predicted peptidase